MGLLTSKALAVLALAMPVAFLATGIATGQAQQTATLHGDGRTIGISDAAQISAGEAMLRVVGMTQGPRLDLAPSNTKGELTLQAPWPLLLGAAYEVVLTNETETHILPVIQTALPPAPATVEQVAPTSPVIPANVLRLHIQFTMPMARGQVANAIRLLDEAGQVVPDAFLNLGVELWSADQRRLTMMFDPGRLKQGVGPNIALGAPLTVGQRYALEVGNAMRDAQGQPLPHAYRVWFDVGPALREPVDPSLWSISADGADLVLAFDRLMDGPSLERFVWLENARGERVATRLDVQDTSARISFVDGPMAESLTLVVARATEDVAGNTVCAPFDVDTSQIVAEVCRGQSRIPLAGITR